MTTFSKYYILKDGNMVKSDHELTNAIEVDEMMQPVISILIEKGFKPVSCCSGHICQMEYDGEAIDPNNAYIAFEDDAITLVNNGFKLPAGFKFDQCDNNSPLYKACIRRIYTTHTDRWTQILEAMGTLYRWALCLPRVNKGGSN